LTFAVLFLGGGGYLIWHFLGRPQSTDELKDAFDDIDFSDFSDAIGNLTDDAFNDFWKSDADPSVGDNTTYEWENGGNGLGLELLNALDDRWQEIYAVALSDWENGTPDSLTLTTKRVAVDNSCTPVDGVMKVCNGNYGETGWLGLNELIIINGLKIKNSVAKMNEHYLLNADDLKRRYVMCHEVGHGFGLPHTDEQFDNKDLGDCLDYTSTPKNNLLPGAVNFNKLKVLYGTVGGGNRNLRLNDVNTKDMTGFSSELASEYDKARREFDEMSKRQARRRRYLKEDLGVFHRLYTRKLDEEHSLHVQVHYA